MEVAFAGPEPLLEVSVDFERDCGYTEGRNDGGCAISQMNMSILS